MVKDISVIGIGKLGLCFALTLENRGYSMVGVDVSESYIRIINDKRVISPRAENWFGEYYSYYDMNDLIPDEWKQI